MTTRLVFLPADPAAEPWVIGVDDAGHAAASGPLAQVSVEAAYTVLAVPGAQALARWVDIPARTEAQARSAAAFLLEDELAAPRGSTHIALGPGDGIGRRLVVVADRAEMQGWLARAAGLGLRPDFVLPDHLLLEPPADGAALSVPIGAMRALRAADLALTCEPDLAPLILGDRPVRQVDEPGAAEALFAQGAHAPLINMLQGEFAIRPPLKVSMRMLAGTLVLAAAVLLAPVASEAVRFVRHAAGAQGAQRTAETLAATLLPAGAAPAGQAREAALARAAALQADGAGGFLAPAAALFKAVEAAPTAEVLRMQYAPDGALRITIRYVDLAAMETIRAELAQAGYPAEEGASTAADGRTVTELTLQVRP